jgi:hypothetical protein
VSAVTVLERPAPACHFDVKDWGHRSDANAERHAIQAVRKWPKPPAPSGRGAAAQRALLDEAHRAWRVGAIREWTYGADGLVSVDGVARSDAETGAYLRSALEAVGIGRTEWGAAWMGRRDVVSFPLGSVPAPAPEVAPKPKRAAKPKREPVVAVVETRAEPVAEPVPARAHVEPLAPPGKCLGPMLDDYLGRLVYGPKREYAAAWIAHVLEGASAPADPGAPWAEKVRGKVAYYVRKAGAPVA